MGNRSKNLASYADIHQQLVAARNLGGANLIFPEKRNATVWRARAYAFRALLRSLAAEKLSGVKGIQPQTEWDDMLLRIEGTTVHIEFGFTLQGLMTTTEGNPVAVEKVATKVEPAPIDVLPVAPDDPALSDEEVLRLANIILENGSKQ